MQKTEEPRRLTALLSSQATAFARDSVRLRRPDADEAAYVEDALDPHPDTVDDPEDGLAVAKAIGLALVIAPILWGGDHRRPHLAPIALANVNARGIDGGRSHDRAVRGLPAPNVD